jgi:dUTP pyrophosphatase
MSKYNFGKGAVSILIEKTQCELGVNVEELTPNSHKKVYVICNRCGEIFKREYRFLYQRHHCPIFKVLEDGRKIKWCDKCKKFLPINQFCKNKARSGGYSSYCNNCVSELPIVKKRHLKQSESIKNSIYAWLNFIYYSTKSRCKNRNIDFSLTKDDLKKIWDNQGGKCYYFNTRLCFAKQSLVSASIERIDSSKGYQMGNVVFTSKFINYGKNRYGVEDMFKLIYEISENINNEIPRVEIKKLDKSVDIPDRSRVTDAGYDVRSNENLIIEPGQRRDVDTGLVVVASYGYYMTIEGRSGMFSKGVVPLRGIIDAGYTGTLKIMMTNISDCSYEIKKGDRIAQICFHKIRCVDFCEVNEISDDYNIRGQSGFGSSGK